MNEPKRIYRIPPCSAYDIPRTQAWIEDMYAQGWHLERDSYFCGTFTFLESKPQRVRCRLEATDTQDGLFSEKRNPTVDALTLYRELGWHWMGRRGQFQIYITDDPAAPELHTDPRVQAMTIKALTKFHRTQACNSLIGMLVYYFLLWRFDISSFIAAVGFWPIVLLATLLLSTPVKQLWHSIKFYRLRKRLEQGDVPSPRMEYHKGRWFHYLHPFLSICIWVLLIWAIFQPYAREEVVLDDWAEPLPFATVQDIFPDAQIGHERSYVDSTVSHWSDWFTPDGYEFYEYANAELPDGTKFGTSLHILYFETKYGWFAMQLAEDFVSQVNGTWLDQLFEDEVTITELEGLDADLAVTWNNHSTFILICKDNRVIKFRYTIYNLDQPITPKEMAQLVLESIQ